MASTQSATTATISNSNNTASNHPPAATTVALPEEDQDDDEDLLVSEFPPPPYYYRRAATLKPPPIPHQKLKEYSQKAAIVLKNAVKAMESQFDDGTGAIASPATASTSMTATTTAASASSESNNTQAATPATMQDGSNVATTTATATTAEGEVKVDTNTNQTDVTADLTASMVTVFGDVVVEDPALVSIPDDCADPTRVRDNVRRLNRKVMQGYIKLINELVHKPLDNKRCRDELSHNVLLMLHECNKFREHQAREILIQALEQQLKFRQSALAQLKDEVSSANEALHRMKKLLHNDSENDGNNSSKDNEEVKEDVVMEDYDLLDISMTDVETG